MMYNQLSLFSLLRFEGGCTTTFSEKKVLRKGACWAVSAFRAAKAWLLKFWCHYQQFLSAKKSSWRSMRNVNLDINLTLRNLLKFTLEIISQSQVNVQSFIPHAPPAGPFMARVLLIMNHQNFNNQAFAALNALTAQHAAFLRTFSSENVIGQPPSKRRKLNNDSWLYIITQMWKFALTPAYKVCFVCVRFLQQKWTILNVYPTFTIREKHIKLPGISIFVLIFCDLSVPLSSK